MAIDEPSPVPRAIPQLYTDWRYPWVEVEYLPPPPTERGDERLFAVLDRRASRRDFRTVDPQSLGMVLWYTAKTWARHGSHRLRWEHRATPSAGGCHPIDVLALRPDPLQLTVYDPVSHALCTLTVHAEALSALRSAVENLFPVGQGTVLWHAAQPGRTLARYEHGESLVWRDAGALVAVTAVVAEGLGLNCCPIGITGEPYLSAALEAEGRVVGVGGVVIGGRG